MTSILLIIAACLSILLAVRGFRRQPVNKASARAMRLAKKSGPTIGRDTDEPNHE